MKTNAKSTVNLFESCLSDLEKNVSEFVKRPGKDFSRHRLLDFKTLIKSIIAMNGKTLDNELIDLFIGKDNIPSESALIQQRNKFNQNVFHVLLKMFQHPITEQSLFNGYRLLAIDGSGLKVADNKDDLESRHSGIGGKAPFNELFIHALFDVMTQSYVDIHIAKLHKNNEPRVFVNMLKNYDQNVPAIFIGDSNYSTFNVMAHIHSIGQKFLLRTKDITSNGSASTFVLPDSDVFDVLLPDLCLTRLQSDRGKATIIICVILPATVFLTSFPQEQKKMKISIFIYLCVSFVSKLLIINMKPFILTLILSRFRYRSSNISIPYVGE